jgi:hypothetical protein
MLSKSSNSIYRPVPSKSALKVSIKPLFASQNVRHYELLITDPSPADLNAIPSMASSQIDSLNSIKTSGPGATTATSIPKLYTRSETLLIRKTPVSEIAEHEKVSEWLDTQIVPAYPSDPKMFDKLLAISVSRQQSMNDAKKQTRKGATTTSPPPARNIYFHTMDWVSTDPGNHIFGLNQGGKVRLKEPVPPLLSETQRIFLQANSSSSKHDESRPISDDPNGSVVWTRPVEGLALVVDQRSGARYAVTPVLNVLLMGDSGSGLSAVLDKNYM